MKMAEFFSPLVSLSESVRFLSGCGVSSCRVLSCRVILLLFFRFPSPISIFFFSASVGIEIEIETEIETEIARAKERERDSSTAFFRVIPSVSELVNRSQINARGARFFRACPRREGVWSIRRGAVGWSPRA